LIASGLVPKTIRSFLLLGALDSSKFMVRSLSKSKFRKVEYGSVKLIPEARMAPFELTSSDEHLPLETRRVGDWPTGHRLASKKFLGRAMLLDILRLIIAV
jgi:hypothetical protein